MKKIILLITLSLTSALTAMSAAFFPYQDSSLTPEERADDLLSRLTVEEKISLMMDRSPAIERLGIKEYNWWNEALHGVGRAGTATVLPQAIGMAATFDDDALYRAFSMISTEARAKYNAFSAAGDHKRYHCLTFWTPNINIFRDPRWGRGQETYGEDPHLTSRLGVAAVHGLQGNNPRFMKTIACAKHFAVHSGPEWNRHSFDANNIDAFDLWSTYLPAFKALVDAGVGQVMCAYNRFEGEPCCSSNRLLQRILREQWGYEKIIVSDCSAIRDFYTENAHHTHPTAASAAGAAVMTGTDLECGSVYKDLGIALSAGQVDMEHIDASLRRLLIARFTLGEMSDDDVTPWDELTLDVVDSELGRTLALEMGHKSIVLLKNNGILPLPESGKRILVVGPNANDSVMQWGNYNGTPSHTVTILDGIRGVVADAAYVRGCELVDTLNVNVSEVAKSIDTAEADVIIFVGGISPKLEGEEMKVSVPGFRGGDRETIELPAVQRQLIAELKAKGKPVVMVNCSGSAVGLAPESEICDAIVQAWYPGQEGGTAVADVLFGRYNPSGRLPVTFYRDDSQLPDFQDYSMDGRTYRFMTEKPLYPFGHGLSYTSFSYENPKVIVSAGSRGEPDIVAISMQVSNTGDMEGDEVVQVYVSRKDDPTGVVKTLAGFSRINLRPGERQFVSIELDPEALKTWDNRSQTMKRQAGEFTVEIGRSSAEIVETLPLTLK